MPFPLKRRRHGLPCPKIPARRFPAPRGPAARQDEIDAALNRALVRRPELARRIRDSFERQAHHLAVTRAHLDTASRQLLQANAALHTARAGKSRALEVLQHAICRLLGLEEATVVTEASIEQLADRLAALAAERESMERAFAEERDRAHVTLASIGDGVLVTDLRGRVTFVNREAIRLIGITEAETRGRCVTDIAVLLDEASGRPLPSHPAMQCRNEQAVISSTQPALLLRANNQRIPVEHTTSPIFRQDGHLTGMVMILRDVSRSREIAQKMSWQATHDALTGLWSRNEFERRLELLIRDVQAGSDTHALLYLDLDQFKVVNDTCGHAAGDELLKQLTFLLQKEIRHSDTLARLGGDEFGVLLNCCPLAVASNIAEKLRATVRDFRFSWEGRIFEVGASIGLVVIDRQIESSSNAMRQADMACYAAKDLGRNRIHVFEANDEELARRHTEMQWASRISEALAHDRFRLYAQEIRPLGEHKEAHFEILVRMIDESGKEIPPGAFIPAAERYNLMDKIDSWVIDHTLAALSASAFLHGEVKLAINLSALSLMDKNLPAVLRQQLRARRIPPETLCFEITETAAIAHLTTAVQFIHELKLLGCKFALDDFGSGMSSFAYLKNLPVDYLKIDGAFVRDILSDPIDRAFVETINRIGKVMGKETIAEFVENAEIMRVLQQLGVDYVQGYGVSKPLPLEDWLQTLSFATCCRPRAA